jgi:hypothetical protein
MLKILEKNGIVSYIISRDLDVFNRRKKGESAFSISIDYNTTVRCIELAYKRMNKDADI